MRNRSVVALLLTGLLAVALLAFGGTGLLESLTGSPTPAASSSAAPVPEAPVPRSGGGSRTGRRCPPNPSGLPAISESALPAEARRTLALIRAGGPYSYSQDDKTFGNFERILPAAGVQAITGSTPCPHPGESDRGARRIVAGAGGEKYYTQDHYDSFKFIAEGS